MDRWPFIALVSWGVFTHAKEELHSYRDMALEVEPSDTLSARNLASLGKIKLIHSN